MNALFVIGGLGIITLVAEIAKVRKGLDILIMAGLALTGALLVLNWNQNLSYYSGMLVLDNFSIAFSVLLAVTAFFWFTVSHRFFEDLSYKTDRSALIVFAVMGGMLMICYNNMSMLFLGIEIISICMYVLAGSRKYNNASNEAAFKYFLMGSFATGFFLFGVALVYGATGSFNIIEIQSAVSAGNLPPFFYAGVMMIFVGLSFKMSAAPFHFWAPDVYQGAPTTITGFMATIVKIASVAAFFKMFGIAFAGVSQPSSILIQVILVLTLVIGNISAVVQDDIKRILAYSSVGHIGYVLLALVAEKDASVIFYYLAAYSAATVAAFAVVAIVERESGPAVDRFSGLFRRDRLLALVLTISMLSLAGIPPLAGFFAKYLVFARAIENGYTGLVILAVLASLVGVYYYFRVIRVMVAGPGETTSFSMSWSLRAALVILLLVNLLIGLFPDQLMALLS